MFFGELESFINLVNKLKSFVLKPVNQSENKLSSEMQDFQKEMSSSKFFKSSTGIRADKYLQQAILNLYGFSKGEISLELVKKAQQYIRFEKNELNIRLPYLSKLIEYSGDLLYWTFSLLCIAFLGLFLVTFTIEPSNILNFSTLLKFITFSLFFAIVFISAAFLFLGNASSVRSAKKIKNYIESNNLIVSSQGIHLVRKRKPSQEY